MISYRTKSKSPAHNAALIHNFKAFVSFNCLANVAATSKGNAMVASQ